MATNLDLGTLIQGMPGITSYLGGTLAEAASVCLDYNGHSSDTDMRLDGDHQKAYTIVWDAPTEQVKRAHADLQDATEKGACGVAILITKDLFNKVVIEQSFKGNGPGRGYGFDYWLGDDAPNLPFSSSMRLEVSGILTGDNKAVQSRVKTKVEQVSRYGGSTPGVAVIVEFSTPFSVARKS